MYLKTKGYSSYQDVFQQNMRLWAQVASGKSTAGYKKKFFTVQATEHRNRLLGEGVESPGWK